MEDLDEDATEPTGGAYFGEIKLLKDSKPPRAFDFNISVSQADIESMSSMDVNSDDRASDVVSPCPSFQSMGEVGTYRRGVASNICNAILPDIKPDDSHIQRHLYDRMLTLTVLDCMDDSFEIDFECSRLHGATVDEIVETILGKISPQCLRTFIHAQRFSAVQTLRFFVDLLACFPFFVRSFQFRMLENCVDQAFDQIRLEKLLAHIIFSLEVVVFVFEYLIGYVQRGGWATYSDTSWEFRATYVSIELRLAAYFWFKFRAWPAQPSSGDRGRKRARAAKGEPSVSCRDERNKFEPRLKEGKRTIWLGEYNTYQEAANAFWVGAFFYDRWERFNDDVLQWCKDNLPEISATLSGVEKASWVREKAEEKRNAIPHSSSVAVENRGGGRVVSVISGTGEGGSRIPMDASLRAPCEGVNHVNSSPQALVAESSNFTLNIAVNDTGDSEFMLQAIWEGDLPLADHPTGIGLGQQFEDFSVDDCLVKGDSGQGEVSGPGVGNSEGLNPRRSFGDQGARHQQDLQHLQQSHGSAIASGCGGAEPEVGATQQADVTEEHHGLRTSANHPILLEAGEPSSLRFAILPLDPLASSTHLTRQQIGDKNLVEGRAGFPNVVDLQAVDPLSVAQQFSNTIEFARQELREQGWKWEVTLRRDGVCPDLYSVAYSGFDGPDLLELHITAPIHSAFKELVKLGWKNTLAPISSA